MHATKVSKAEGIYVVSNPLEVTIKVDALSRNLDQLMASSFVPTSTPPTYS